MLLSPLTPATVIAQADPATSKTLLEYVLAGREIGLIIVLLSLVAVGMIIAQTLRLRRSSLAPESQTEHLRALLAERKIRAAIEYCASPDESSFLTGVIGPALDRCARSPFGLLELRSAIEETGRARTAALSRAADAVGLIASVSPMLGLLGTVVGLVGAFDTIALSDGPARPDELGGSISQALVTTVLGLIVAIPCTAAHAFLRSRIERVVGEIGDEIEDIIALVGAPTPAQPPAGQQAPPQPAQARQPVSQPGAGA